MVVQTNAKIFEKKYNTVTFGVHRNILFGDYRKTFKELACFIGYDLIEEDRDEST